MTSINASTHLARAVVASLAEAGVTDVVIAPGSRNAPLSFAVLAASRAGLLRLHTRIDERSAGFLALGLTKGGARAAVMCTSGTAVANLHPAALEAAHSGLPLVVVTADRPARLRGTGANQVTDQVGIFGPLLATRDVASPDDLDVDELWSATGPLHWNVQLDEPLTPDGAWDVPELLRRPPIQRPEPPIQRPEPRILETIDAGPRTVVVAGDGAGPAAAELAEAAGWPLLAEPSGHRVGPNAIRTYRLLLESDLGAQIERAVVFGHPTLSRPVARLLNRVEVWQRPVPGAWSTPAYSVDRTFRTALQIEGDPDAGWLAAWQGADRSVARQLDQLLAAHDGLTPHEVAAAVAAAVSAALPGDGLLVVGPSNPVRDLDLMLTRHERRRLVTNDADSSRVLASRGLAGIDGLVSTAIGAALAHGRPSLALVGDVTFLHDSNGLVLGPDEPRPDLTIVVVNDDGGSIFATLEQGADEYAGDFERLFGTPHHVDIASLCAATRTPHWKVTTRAELEHALAAPNGGIEVVEAVVGRADRRALDTAIRALRP